MADPRSQNEQEEEHDGATPQELLIEAARRGNTDLLQEVIDSQKSPEAVAELLNSTKTVLGNYLYHEAALRGNYDIIDMLLDQEGFECDPLSLREGDTPLHSAIRFINSLPQPLSPPNADFASSLLSMMIESGSDPRLRNKANLLPAQLIDPALVELKQQLQDAADVMLLKGDFVEEEEEEEEGEYEGSGDEDEREEWRVERERRAREGMI